MIVPTKDVYNVLKAKLGGIVMKDQTEIWKALPGVLGVEVSTFGNVRVLDRVISSESMTRFTKGHILKQYDSNSGYLQVRIPVGKKWATKSAHRLVAQTFISNPDNLPQVNHKNCDRHDNRVSNLEWVTTSYNIQYREKFGKAAGRPVFAINLSTLEVYQYPSQIGASRELGVFQQSINAVINGKRKYTGDYWLTEADDNAVDITKRKLREIGETRLTAADEASADFVSQVLAD